MKFRLGNVGPKLGKLGKQDFFVWGQNLKFFEIHFSTSLYHYYEYYFKEKLNLNS